MKQKFKWHRFISHVEHSLSLPETFSIKIAWKEAALSLWWEEKGTTEAEMVGWHHRLNGHEFE